MCLVGGRGASRGGALHFSAGESVPPEGLPSRLLQVLFCCWLAAPFGPLNPRPAGLCMLRAPE